MTVAVAVFAAGRGSRLGGDASKPLLEWRGRPLLAWALDAAIASGLAPVLVTIGYRAADVRASLPASVEILDNPEWEEGIAASLRAVLTALAPRAEVTLSSFGLLEGIKHSERIVRMLCASHPLGLAQAFFEDPGELRTLDRVFQLP